MVTLTATAQTGSQFTGWSGACTGAGTCTVAMTQAQSVTATFAPFTPTLTVTLAGTGTGTVTSSPAGINCGATCAHSYNFGDTVTLTAAIGTGATFTGWTGACTGTSTCTVSMTQAQNVTATFDALTPQVTVALSGNGIGTVASSPAGINCGSSCTASFTFGAMVTLTATAQTGSTFAGWTGACSGTSATCIVTADRARAVGAEFDAVTPPLTVTFAGTGGGEITSAPAGLDCTANCTVTFSYATMVTLTATAQTGSTFTGWSGACTGTSPCVVSMTAARSVTATFKLQSISLATSTTGNGMGTIGASPAGTSFPYGTVVVLTATAQPGSTFTGWGGDCTGTQASCTLAMTQARTVTAAFTLQTFPLTVVKNGAGTVTPSPTGTSCGGGCWSYNYGTSVTLIATAQAGSTFTGWSGADAGACAGTTSPTCTVTIDQARTITATFALQQFDVAYVLAGTGSGTVAFAPGGASCGGQCATYPYGTQVTLTATPATGSTFTGWSGSGAGACAGTSTANCVLTVDQARTVTATFTINTENLTVVTSGNGGVTLSVAGTACGTGCTQYPYGTVVTLTASAQTGAVFSGWSGADAGTCAGTSTATCTVSMDRPRTITATFTAAPENLSWTYTGAGTGSVSPSPAGTSCGAQCATFGYGQVVTLTATPTAGSTFGGWTGGGCSGTGTCMVTMTSAIAVQARFDVQQITLNWSTTGAGAGTLTPTPAGTSCGATCASFAYGTTVTMSESPSTGSSFNSWSGACSGSGACSVTLTAAKTVSAQFDLLPENLNLVTSGSGTGTIATNPMGASCGATCQTYSYGQVVMLTATPTGGSIFLGWSGAGCTGTGPCTVTMTSGQTVTASFGGPQTLAVVRNGTGSGTVSSSPAGINCGATCTATFPYNTTVNLTASASTGSTFTGWTGDCTGSSTTCSVPMTQARNVTATFAINPETLTVARSGTGSGTVTSSPAGINCGSACSMTVNYGTMITLTASPSAGSTFGGWTGGGCGSGTTCTVSMTTAQNVTATFTISSYTVAVTFSGGGAGSISMNGVVCSSSCSQTYTYGTAVTITATDTASSLFQGWSGPCSGTGTCGFSVTGATSVGVTFVPAYTLTVAPLPTKGYWTDGVISCGHNGGGPCTAKYPAGSSIDLQWNGDACTNGLGNYYPTTVTGCTYTISLDCALTLNANTTVQTGIAYQNDCGSG
jgi:uncharacterized repeat protein (TIGR02543 family)